MEKYNILGLNVDNLTYNTVISLLESEKKQVVINSVNPEITLQSEKDKELKEIIMSSDYKIADGIGIVWAVKKFHNINIDRITGIDLMEEILKSSLGSKRIYLYGAKEGVANGALLNLNEKYQCNIIGTMSGYEQDNDKIINDIIEKKADIVFVGLGCPRQEKWINDNKDKLKDVSILMGVGGSFDVLSGNVKRAPSSMQKLHLEWLYRLLSDPKRIFRQLNLIKFVFKVSRQRKKVI